MSQMNQVTLDIADESPTESNGRNNQNFLRMDSTSRSTVSLRNNNHGLSDRLNNVFREIRPLVENARMGNNAHLSLPTWLRRNSTTQAESPDVLQRPQSSIAQVNIGPTAQTFILTERSATVSQRSTNGNHIINSSHSNDTNSPDHTQGRGDIAPPNNTTNNNTGPVNEENESQSDEGEQQVMDIRELLGLLIKYAPFYFILFIKYLYDRREGLFTFFILLCTFVHSNSLVRREHGKQMNRNIVALFFELVTTVSCIIIVHYLFGHDRLLPNVVMFPGYTGPIDIWELLWLVCLTDIIVKIITVNVKIIITMMPAVVLPFQKRGKLYLFVESISQLYRSLLPIQPWFYYLMQSYEGSEKMVGVFLSSAYVIAKLIELLIQLKLFKNATWTLLQSVNLGTKPTGDQLLSAGDSCPICHDDFTTPVRLGCGHIFCELCIAAWLDREHTCPLCRAKVTDEPTWRDGSTTHYFQLY